MIKYLFLLFLSQIIFAQSENENYFIVEIGRNSSTFEMMSFTKNSSFIYCGYGYILDFEELYTAVKNNKLELNSDKLILDSGMGTRIGTALVFSDLDIKLSFTCGFYGALNLDNTPIFKIGDKLIAVVRLKYKSERVTIPNLRDYIKIEHGDEVTIFRELVEICRMDKELVNYIWKIKSELDDFWFENNRKLD